jgi:predicted enzyme related to lactoylglutathione lyase
MPHPIVHIELSANDHGQAAQWYQDVFGWQTQAFPEMNYSTAQPAEGAVGLGFNPVSEQQPAGTVTAYIHCPDIAATVASLEAKGGQILMPPTPIPTIGQIALFRDPTGNMMGLLQPEMDE